MYATSRSTSTSTTIPVSATSQGLHPSATRDDSTVKGYEELIATRAAELVTQLEKQRGEVSLGLWLNYFRCMHLDLILRFGLTFVHSFDFMSDMA